MGYRSGHNGIASKAIVGASPPWVQIPPPPPLSCRASLLATGRESSGHNRLVIVHLSFQENNTPGVNIADEPTGPLFSPDKKVLFLNLQRANGTGVTIGITGPFAKRSSAALADNAPPTEAQPIEVDHLRTSQMTVLGMSVGATAAWMRLRRLGRISEVPAGVDDLVSSFGPLRPVDAPKRRLDKLSL